MRCADSVQGKFLDVGKGLPIEYFVTRVREGRSYATRDVLAKADGRMLYVASVSYQRPEPEQPLFYAKAPEIKMIEKEEFSEPMHPTAPQAVLPPEASIEGLDRPKIATANLRKINVDHGGIDIANVIHQDLMSLPFEYR